MSPPPCAPPRRCDRKRESLLRRSAAGDGCQAGRSAAVSAGVAVGDGRAAALAVAVEGPRARLDDVDGERADGACRLAHSHRSALQLERRHHTERLTAAEDGRQARVARDCAPRARIGWEKGWSRREARQGGEQGRGNGYQDRLAHGWLFLFRWRERDPYRY